MKHTYILLCLVLCGVCGCATTERISLKDINPSRVYNTTVPALFDEVRLFGLQEGFRLERFEQESGRIIGHKSISVSSSEAGMLPGGGTTKRIVMVLKTKPKTAQEVSLIASFVYGDAQLVLNRSDEDELIACYRMLFRHLDRKLGAGQISDR
jgi:hypothetical protein